MRLDRKKIVLLMMDANINTKELAKRANVSRATVSAIKNGRSCSEDTAIKIATALKVDIRKILE